MSRLTFYLTVPIIWLLSRLPFRVLYFISDYFLYPVLYKLLGYRLKVVRANLDNSFPEKTLEEKRKIEKAFYHYLSDLFVETLKSFSLSEDEILRRVSYKNEGLLKEYLEKYGGLVLSLGHVGNYEWLCLQFTPMSDWMLVGPYRRLNNPYFDSYFKKSRERTGAHIFHTYDTTKALETLLADGKKFVLALVNDQSAPANRAYWGRFLNQDTAFYVGTEKLSRQLGFPVVYLNIRVKSRGYYEVEVEKISDNPREEPLGKIMKEHIKKVEQNILQAPQYWLWSHKRWKYKKPDGLTSGFAKKAGIS